MREELIEHPIPNPVIDSDGKHYKKFDDVWKKEVSKKPLQLPESKKKSVDQSKKPGFNVNSSNARTSVKCSLCRKPRLVYSQYKTSGNGLRKVREKFVALQEGNDFQCGNDTSKLFQDDSNLKSKNITTDRRLNCGSPIEFAHYTKQHSVKGTVGRCAFCGDKLDKSATKTVKTLLEKECKVLPSCGKPVCLSMNPKANFQNGWTVKAKQSRKRKQTTGSKAKAKKAKQAESKKSHKKD